MTEVTFKDALRAAIEGAIKDVGFETFKQTSMFPLSRRKSAAERVQKQAA